MADRQHLYRGKRKDNGEWVEGKLFDDGLIGSNRMFVGGIVIEKHKGTADNRWNITGIDFCEVDSETVCECTGLEDKNGKLIFEDDIVKTTEYGKVIGYSNVNDYDVFKIVYVPAFFKLENKDREFLIGEYSKHLEVIGNIHDNPELLEV